jgi:hypothetical protein
MTLKADATISRPARLARALLALLGTLLLVDALVLMGMGHFNVGVVPAGLGAAALGLSWKWRAVQHWRAARPLHARLWSLAWAGLALWLISLFWFWSRLSGLGLAPQQVPPVQSIVVLGSGTLDGHPRPVLAARLDRRRNWPSCSPRPWSPFAAVSIGVKKSLRPRSWLAICSSVTAAQRLVLEKLSTSTELNLKLSRPLLAERGVAADAPMAMVSSDFHLMRAMDIAKRQDLPQVYPVAAPTPLATRFNAWLREYFAMASSWLLGEV